MEIINLIRRIVLKQLDLAQERLCVIDSLPVPAVKFHLVPSSTGDWKAHGAKFGKVSSKNETIFGYKLHLLTTISGLILDFELAPANATDLNVGYELLQNHTGLKIFGDKGYISADKQRLLWEQRKSRLYTLKRSNQKKQISAQASRLINSVRQIIETVNSQLAGQFNIETNHAHTFWGLCSRLVTKLTAHTLSIYINRLLGNHDFLQIKALAFPN
jgi:phage gp46-like protein